MTPRVQSFKVIKVDGTDMAQPATYDFLLVVSIGLSRTVSEINGEFGRKSAIFFSPPCI